MTVTKAFASRVLATAVAGAVVLAGASLGSGCDGEDTPCTTDRDCGANICGAGTCQAAGAGTRASLDLVSIPSGQFTMGCDVTTVTWCEGFESPAHTVTTAAYVIERTEVSARDFADFLSQRNDNTCGAGKCVWTSRADMPLESADGTNWTPKAGLATQPMVQVRWHGAADYCEFRGLRLCSEAEWEKAAVGGCEVHGGDCASTTPAFPWGDDAPTCSLAHMDDGSGPGCGTDSPAAVSTLAAGKSPYGVLNMAGNVWEWVQDYYHAGYAGAPDDGSAWEADPTNWRVFKGGGGRSDEQHLRGAARGNGGPDDGNEFRGFRCCGTP